MTKAPKRPSASHATMKEYIDSHQISERDVGAMVEQRVVDQDGTTIEFYQFLKGRVPILGKDPEAAKKYLELAKDYVAALEEIEALKEELKNASGSPL